MYLMRIAGALAAVAVAAGILLWLFTGERRYLVLSARVAKGTLIFVLLVLALMFLERVIAI